jgi:hypothetical protein
MISQYYRAFGGDLGCDCEYRFQFISTPSTTSVYHPTEPELNPESDQWYFCVRNNTPHTAKHTVAHPATFTITDTVTHNNTVTDSVFRGRV